MSISVKCISIRSKKSVTDIQTYIHRQTYRLTYRQTDIRTYEHTSDSESATSFLKQFFQDAADEMDAAYVTGIVESLFGNCDSTSS